MKKKKTVNPPTEKEEALLDSIVENSKDTVEIRGRKWHVAWMRNGTKRKVTHIMLTEKEDDKVNSKCAAAIVLNGYWKILFFYWFLWRWFFYVMQYSDEELLPLIETGKKIPIPCMLSCRGSAFLYRKRLLFYLCLWFAGQIHAQFLEDLFVHFIQHNRRMYI